MHWLAVAYMIYAQCTLAFMTTVLPPANAGPSFQACMAMGKFLLLTSQHIISGQCFGDAGKVQVTCGNFTWAGLPRDNLAHHACRVK